MDSNHWKSYVTDTFRDEATAAVCCDGESTVSSLGFGNVAEEWPNKLLKDLIFIFI